MLEFLLEWDEKCLLFLNSLGANAWDNFWLFITQQINWTPYFIILTFLLFRKYPLKQSFFAVLFLIVMIAFSDQFTNLIRIIFERPRPNNNPFINQSLRHYPNFLIDPQSFSFTSGHATTSMAVTIFTYKLLKSHYKHLYWLFIFPLFFSYSRLYLGVHFPLDIFCGACIGTLIGLFSFTLLSYCRTKFFS